MVLPPFSLHAADGAVAVQELSRRIDALLEGTDVPIEFPAEVLAAAEAAASASPGSEPRSDRTDIPFVTLDPATSTDLDQAMDLTAADGGFVVRYAIADVPSFVALDGVIDAEARRRGQTVYLPDRRIPLHPEAISEGAGSLLPDQDAPAFVWTLTLDPSGEVTDIALERALVRSREKLAYDAVQADLDAGRGHPQMLLLQQIGALRAQLETQREGASLNLPEQEVVADGDTVGLSWRAPAPIEDANAQISLMTGMAAARVMIEGGAGILRTMPPADEKAVRRFRWEAAALGQQWPEDMPYGQFLRTLDPADPHHLSLLNEAASLFRGASYLAFIAREELPADPVEHGQAAIGAPYAHTTAPLRRLVDRFVLLVCHAHLSGQAPVPDLLAALPLIPPLMQESSARAGTLQRAGLDLVEVMALVSYTGRTCEGTVIDRREASEGDRPAPARVLVRLQEPPVTRWVPSSAQVGDAITVRVVSADPAIPDAVLEDASTDRPAP